MTPGRAFRNALAQSSPLQIVGVPNALSAKLAKQQQLKAIYLSGAGVANGCLGLPDLGITDINDTLTEVHRITQACDLPLLVDIDTAGANPLMIQRWIKALIQAGAAACHIEDQTRDKRCGHRDNKQLCSIDEMVKRITVAVAARTDADFYIIARTDAYASEGFAATVARANAYINAGADAIFAEALPNLDELKQFKQAVACPVLANLTEFGKTQLFDCDQAEKANIDMLLYPLTAFRAMNKAAERVYQQIKQHGQQQGLLKQMQTRDELYELLNYHEQEAVMDKYYE